MKIKRIVLIVGGCALMANCVSEYHGPGTVIGQPRILQLPVSSSTTLDIKLDVGDVTVVSTNSNQLSAEMIIKCPGIDSRCAKRLADLDWVSAITGEQLTLMTNRHSASKLSSLRYRDAEITIRIEIPKVKQVNIEMVAGNLRIDNVDACFDIDMDAGDIDLEVTRDAIGSVDIDTGVGDASLTVDGSLENQHRPLLIGAEVHWHDGSGDCEMKVDLQAGDAEIRLTD